MEFPTTVIGSAGDDRLPAASRVLDGLPADEPGDVYTAVSNAFANAARNGVPVGQLASVIEPVVNHHEGPSQPETALGLERLHIPGLDLLTPGLGDGQE